MITIADYFGGRRESHGLECSPRIENNALRTVDLVNELLENCERFGVVVKVNPAGDFAGTLLNSGWRPPSINGCTPGASATSLHMTGEAADIHDADGALDEFLLTPEGQFLLGDIGLWLESPTKTHGWCHVQTKPPRSGQRVFMP